MSRIGITLAVDDQGSPVVKRFTSKTVDRVKQMSDRSTRSVERMSAKFKKKLGGAISKVGGMLTNLKTLAVGALAGWGLSRLIDGFIETGSAMDQMRLSLDTITKGKGQEWFKKLNEWALKMPVNTEKAIESFIMMRAMGLRPSIDQMTILVDTMSALGGKADTMQGIARALGQIQTKGKVSAEELMQLAERGVPVFEILKKKFGEVETSSLDASQAIRAIFEGMEERFGGQSRKIQNKWSGLTETLKSYWTDFKRMVMDSGVMAYLEAALKKITDKIGALRSSGDLQKYAKDIAQAVKNAGTAALNSLAGIIETIPTIKIGFATLGKTVSTVTTGIIALGAAAVDAAALVAATVNPYWAIKVAVNGYRETFPTLAKMKDSLDAMGVKAATAGNKFDAMGNEAAANTSKAAQMAEKVRGVAQEVVTAADKQKEAVKSTGDAAQQSAQKMTAVWKDKIIQIDGVWTNLREKVMVPLDSTLKVKDEATGSLKKVEEQTKKTQQTIEKNPTISVNDQATPVLKTIQSEMAKIKDKTVRVKVVHTGTGSTERPLTDKIREIQGMYDQLPNQMSMNADFTSVTAGLRSLLDISNKLGSTEAIYRGNQKMASSVGITYTNLARREEIDRLSALYKRVSSFMFGGGSSSSSSSSGSSKNISIDQLNINVSEAAPQTAEDWRSIVREDIVPELERIGYA